MHPRTPLALRPHGRRQRTTARFSLFFVLVVALLGCSFLAQSATPVAAAPKRAPTPTPASPKATMTSPTPGSTLPGASTTFSWSAGIGVTQYHLYVGTTAGSANIYNKSQGTNRSVTITNLPTNGSTVYVRLWSLVNGAWQSNDYTYKAASTAAATAQPTATPTATPTPTPTPTPPATPTAKFVTLPPGTLLPSDSECAARVRRAA